MALEYKPAHKAMDRIQNVNINMGLPQRHNGASGKFKYLTVSSSRVGEVSRSESWREGLKGKRITHYSGAPLAKVELSLQTVDAVKHGDMHTLPCPILTQEFPDAIFPCSNKRHLLGLPVKHLLVACWEMLTSDTASEQQSKTTFLKNCHF